jgi:hypothetical protein
MVLLLSGGGGGPYPLWPSLGYFNQPGALAKSELLENHNRNFWDFANFTTLKSFCISKTASTGLKSISIFRCTQKMGVEQQMDVEQNGGEPTLASHGLKKGQRRNHSKGRNGSCQDQARERQRERESFIRSYP